MEVERCCCIQAAMSLPGVATMKLQVGLKHECLCACMQPQAQPTNSQSTHVPLLQQPVHSCIWLRRAPQ